MKNYEDLRSKYNKLQEENISLTDLTKLIPQDEAAQVIEKWSARDATKEEGAMLIIFIYCFFPIYIFLNLSLKNYTINWFICIFNCRN